MTPRSLIHSAAMAVFFMSLVSCGFRRSVPISGKKTIVATYSVLGAAVKELAGDSFEVRTVIPNGLDVHEWEPSAQDIEALTKADLIVENGLGLEGGLEKTLSQAKASGVGSFSAVDHITVRTVGAGEGIPSGDPDQEVGAQDPHLWTDPLAMKAIVDALAADIQHRFGVDLSTRAAELDKRLEALDAEIKARVQTLPPGKRKLVTGHESLGYFAQRYGFKLVGAVIPSLTTEADSSAASMGRLKKLIQENHVRVVFTEIGTPTRTVEALAKEARVTTVPLTTHSLPPDGSYFSFERELAVTLIQALQR